MVLRDKRNIIKFYKECDLILFKIVESFKLIEFLF